MAFSTEIKGHRHLQGNVQVHNVPDKDVTSIDGPAGDTISRQGSPEFLKVEQTYPEPQARRRRYGARF